MGASPDDIKVTEQTAPAAAPATPPPASVTENAETKDESATSETKA